jgi:excisionase family DNA binding protein
MIGKGTAMTEPLLYTLSDATAATGLPRSTLYALLAAKKITARKIGRRTLVDAASLRAFIEGQPFATPAVPSLAGRAA